MTENQTFDARAFIETIREIQRENGKKLVGRQGLSQTTLAFIRLAAQEVCEHSIESKVITAEHRQSLLQRFEEMCRRNGQSVDKTARSRIMRYLTAELALNVKEFGLSPDKLLPVTAYSGAVGLSLRTEFADFADSPGIFKRAAVGNPSDPRGFLRQLKADKLKL